MAGGRSPSRSIARSRSSEHERRPGRARRRGLRGIVANLAAWLSLIGRPRRFKAGRLLPPTRRLALGAIAGHRCWSAIAMVFLDARAVMLRPRAAALAGRYLQRDHRLWPVGLVPGSARRPDPAGGDPSRRSAGRIANLVLPSLVVRLHYLFLAIAVPGLAVTVVKGLIGRVRPSELGPFAYFPWSWQHEYASLPSGHSTTAFAAAVAIAALWPRTRIPMLIFAVVIAASRVVITAHFVSDVVAAAFVGALRRDPGAQLVRGARARFRARAPTAPCTSAPGPSWRRIKAVARRLIGQ